MSVESMIAIVVAVIGASAALWASDALGRSGRLRRRIIAHQDVIARLDSGWPGRDLLARHVDHEVLQLLVAIRPRGWLTEWARRIAFSGFFVGVYWVSGVILLDRLGVLAERTSAVWGGVGLSLSLAAGLIVLLTDLGSWATGLVMAQELRRRSSELRQAFASFLYSAMLPDPAVRRHKARRRKALAVRAVAPVRTLAGTRRPGARRPGKRHPS